MFSPYLIKWARNLPIKLQIQLSWREPMAWGIHLFGRRCGGGHGSGPDHGFQQIWRAQGRHNRGIRGQPQWIPRSWWDWVRASDIGDNKTWTRRSQKDPWSSQVSGNNFKLILSCILIRFCLDFSIIIPPKFLTTDSRSSVDRFSSEEFEKSFLRTVEPLFLRHTNWDIFDWTHIYKLAAINNITFF